MPFTENDTRATATAEPEPAGPAPASEPLAPPREKVPALFVYIAFFAVGFMLDRLLPLPFSSGAIGRIAGWVLLAPGLAMIVWTLLTFLVKRVSPASFVPTRGLIVTGPFRLSRHPLYLAGLVAYLGGALLGNLPWTLVAAVPLAMVIQRLFVEREEAYLEERFGDEYRAYKARVRRWI